MKTAVFVSVRDKATRLPGKVFLPFAGRPAIERLIQRMTRTGADAVVVCTSMHPDDEKLLATARTMGIEGFAGSEDDKLDRYLAAAVHYGIEIAAIVDGDDILCDPGYVDRLLSELDERTLGGDYGVVEGLPLGATAFCLRIDALRRVCEIKAQSDTEVWGGYFTETGLFDVLRLAADPPDHRPELRLTLDYPEDYEVMRTVYEAVGPADGGPSIREIIAYCDAHPELVAINAGVQERYERNLEKSAPVRLRS